MHAASSADSHQVRHVMMLLATSPPPLPINGAAGPRPAAATLALGARQRHVMDLNPSATQAVPRSCWPSAAPRGFLTTPPPASTAPRCAIKRQPNPHRAT
jgi:hypothetical protein